MTTGTKTAGPAPAKAIAEGESELHPRDARTPARLLTMFSKEELDAFADCMQGLDGPIPPADLAKFIWFCTRSGLDPFADEVVCVYQSDHGVKKPSIRVEVQGYRAAAWRTGEVMAVSEPEWGPLVKRTLTYKDKTRDVQIPEWARVTIVRKQNGELKTIPQVCFFDDFYNPKNNIWFERPRWFLGLRTEGHAFKKGFPDKFSRTGWGGGDDDGERPVMERDDPGPGTTVKPALGPQPAPTPRRPAIPDPQPPATAGARS